MADIPVTSILLQAGSFALNSYWQEGKLLEASLTRKGAPNTWLFYTRNEAELVEFLGMCDALLGAIREHQAAPPAPVVEVSEPPHNRPEAIDAAIAALQEAIVEQLETASQPWTVVPDTVQSGSEGSEEQPAQGESAP